MKKTVFLFLLCLMGIGAFGNATSRVFQSIQFSVRLIDPYKGTKNPFPKTPAAVPNVSICERTLRFEGLTYNVTLQLADETQEVVYTVLVPTGTYEMDLPYGYSGTYELQILRGNYCFYSEITLP